MYFRVCDLYRVCRGIACRPMCFPQGRVAKTATCLREGEN